MCTLTEDSPTWLPLFCPVGGGVCVEGGGGGRGCGQGFVCRGQECHCFKL